MPVSEARLDLILLLSITSSRRADPARWRATAGACMRFLLWGAGDLQVWVEGLTPVSRILYLTCEMCRFSYVCIFKLALSFRKR